MKLYLKRFTSIICVSALMIGLMQGFRYILVDDTNSYTRIMMNQMYSSDENIDVLFLGSSHCYRSVIPEIMDKSIGKYTFNMGTSSQELDGSLAIIKEVLKYHDVQEIYLEMYYAMAVSSPYKEREQLTNTYIIADYMKPSLNKVNYLLEASSNRHYSNSFIVARRNWEKIFDIEYIQRIIKQKAKDTYINYEWVCDEDEFEYYLDRGFVANDGALESAIWWNDSAWDSIKMNLISDCWKESLNEIIELCDAKNVKLTIFVAPMPQSTLTGKGNYDEYTQYLGLIAENAQIEYYDFNLCKDEYFNSMNYKYFKDNSHLNTMGAEKFSDLFGKLISGAISKRELFYDSYEEKLLSQNPMVLGVAGPKDNEADSVREGRIISNRNTGIEYKLVTESEEGEIRLIQNYSEETMFVWPIDEHGTLVIEWKNVDSTIDESHVIEIDY